MVGAELCRFLNDIKSVIFEAGAGANSVSFVFLIAFFFAASEEEKKGE